MNAIIWPDKFTPGMTDNYVSNEIIVPGLTAADVWSSLINTKTWPSYYSNASDIKFRDGGGPELRAGSLFQFTTFSFLVLGEVNEYEPPANGKPGRIAWNGLIEGEPATRLEVHHAWLFEDLPGGRVRILTQESQLGQPAKDMATAKPNPMLNAHQEWIEGLARYTSGKDKNS